MVRVELQVKPPPAKIFEKIRTGNTVGEVLAKIHKEYPQHFVKVLSLQEVPGEQGEVFK